MLTENPDRKSTRLNSSHLGISYAVFCLKKKKCIMLVWVGLRIVARWLRSEVPGCSEPVCMGRWRTPCLRLLVRHPALAQSFFFYGSPAPPDLPSVPTRPPPD